MTINPAQFKPNEAWVISRLKSILFVKNEPVDIYILMDAATGYAFPPLTFLGELPSAKEFQAYFKRARKNVKTWPKTLYLGKEDPAEALLKPIAEEIGATFSMVPTTHLNPILQPLRESYDRFQTGQGKSDLDPAMQTEITEAMKMLPESYDPCPCASGKKYKFCCKVIFREIMEAMVAAEEGDFKSALKWMDEAKGKVGETAEVLCRYGIVYSYRSEEEFLRHLELALKANRLHPRTHYLFGILYKQKGELTKAAASYESAIANYPSSDKFHLNETWNNLGTIRFEQRDFAKAKGAWEKALMYMPRDQNAKANLIKCIYENSELSKELRTPSPFVTKFL